MNLAAPFIRRPVATILVMAAIVLLGVVAYIRLPVASPRRSRSRLNGNLRPYPALSK